MRPSAGLTPNCTLEPPVSTPISRSTASEASRMIWYSLSVRVSAGAAHGEGRPDDGGQADFIERAQRVGQRLGLDRARRLEADPGHGFAETAAILGLVDGIGSGADHLDVEFRQRPLLAQAERAIQ